MLGGKRTERIAELIKTELGLLILTKLKDPRLGFVTVTHVKISADLGHARVMYSVMNTESAEKTEKALESARGFLQHELADRLKLRLTPYLDFYLDKSSEHSFKIESIIRKIHEEES